MQSFLTTVEQVLRAMPLFAIVFALAFGARWLFQKTTRFCIDDELTEKDNPAFGIAFSGYIVGVAIALAGALYGWEGVEPLAEFLTIALFGAIAAVLMRLSFWINDRAILYRFSIEKELIVDQNAGTGFVVAGSSIATGFMLRGVLTGFSTSIWTGLRDVAIYFLVGQAILIAGGWVYTKFAGYDVHDEIGEKNNVSAGISLGGYLVALGYIASIALTGATSEWLDEVVTSFVLAFFGIVLLIAARAVADVFLLPKSPLAKEVAVDRNTAAGAVAAASFLLVAVLFAASVNPNRTVGTFAPLAPEGSAAEATPTDQGVTVPDAKAEPTDRPSAAPKGKAGGSK